MNKSCEYCINFEYDEELDEFICIVNRDEDELARERYSPHTSCPYFRGGDEYTIVRKQN